MSYRCNVCEVVVPSGRPLLRHTIYREKSGFRSTANGPEPTVFKQIAREIPVCPQCYEYLRSVPLPILQRQRGKPITPPILVKDVVASIPLGLSLGRTLRPRTTL